MAAEDLPAAILFEHQDSPQNALSVVSILRENLRVSQQPF